MTYVIKVYGPVGVVISQPDPEMIAGQYLSSYDPEAHDGQGDASFTNDRAKALEFETVEAALAFAHASPIKRPLRADGRPNRPLTAFHLDVQQA